jgi:hypothetical protein
MNRFAATVVGCTAHIALVLAAVPAAAAVRTVCPAGCAYTGIQSAIVAAAAGDTVLVYPGSYAEQLDFLGKAITVRSDGGPGVTVVDAQKKNSVVRFVTGEGAGSILQGFTLTGGESANGGGVYVAAASPVIRDCVITANRATAGGGGLQVVGISTATLEGCRISGNESLTSGGGIYLDSSTLSLTNSEVSGNEAAQYGGGIYSYKGTLVLSGSTVSGNRAVSEGGGIYAGTSRISVTSSVISGNVTEIFGGGVFAGNTTLTLTGSTLEGNRAALAGGGVAATGSSSVVSLFRSSLLGNNAGQDGGGLYVGGGPLTLDGSLVSRNSAGRDGGGLFLDSGAAGASFTRTDITGNTALVGGGLYGYESNVTMDRCRLAGNYASGFGGAVGITNPGIWTVTNTQIDGNQASNNGAGLWINGASVSLKHVTLAANRTFGRGGAAAVAAGTLSVVSSIVWGNYADTGNNPIYPATPTVTYSDIQGGYTGTGNINLDPLFVNILPVNSTPTAAGDYRLLAGSPCIDQALADGAVPPTDRDGDPRPQGPAPDMGADEQALLQNGAFDVVTVGTVPVSWVGSKLARGDGLVENGNTTPFSMGLKGGAGTKKLSQSVALAGAAGNVIHLSFRHGATKPARAGGFLGIQVKLTNNDGTKTVFRAPIPRTTHGWETFSDTFLVPKSFSQMTVSLVASAVTGRVWFDDLNVAVR